jgi:16S rRNA (guanine527-N7)-methyltransferase
VSVAEVLGRQASAWGLSIGSEAEASLLHYAHILSSYDRANVIGTRGFDRIVQEHILDSLSCLLVSHLGKATKIADIGSGGGLPGIPLAIMLPGTDVTLFESVAKKGAFLRYAAEELELENVRVVDGRVEEAARDDAHRGVYDACTARAVSRLSVLAEYCLPLSRANGRVVAMKGKKDGEEWAAGERAARMLGGRLSGEILVSHLPEVEQRERRLVLLEKVAETPDVYPRRVGMPAKNPLGAR